MKPFTLFIMLVALAMISSGCSALYTDKEIGKAQMGSYDKQIAHPDYRFAQKIPNTMEGIVAEEVMQTYSESFQQGFSKQDIDITSTGLETN